MTATLNMLISPTKLNFFCKLTVLMLQVRQVFPLNSSEYVEAQYGHLEQGEPL